MLSQIGQPTFEVSLSLVLHAPHRRDQYRSRRHDARLLHDDVEIFLRAQIGGKSAFVDHVIGQTQSHLLADDAARAVRDVSEGPGMDKSGRAVGSLHQIGKNRFIQKRSEEHTSELQSRLHLVCRLLLEKKKKKSSIEND